MIKGFRKLLGLLVCGGMLLGPWTTTAFAAEVAVVGSTTDVIWDGGNTYVVNGDVAIDGIVTVNGNVTLRLEEGAKLTVTRGGIVVEDGKSLTIEGTGTLEVQGRSGSAGIGGKDGSSCGTVTINGGTVKARGGAYSAGIGGGGTSTSGGNGGTVIITGGIVEATGGSSGAGIGGGGNGTSGGAGGTVTITGGTVTAEGGSCGAGIGGGQQGDGGTVTISGGIVIAKKGSGTTTETIGHGMSASASGTRSITQGVVSEDGWNSKVYGNVTLDEEKLNVFPGGTITVPSGASLTLRTATGQYQNSPVRITAEAGGAFTVVKKGESSGGSTPGGSTSGGSVSSSLAASEREVALPETANPVNEKVSQEALEAGQSLSFRLYNDLAAISRETADILGMSQGTLTVINDRMTVVIPGGYGPVTEKGRVHYPMNFISDPAYSPAMRAAVQGENVRTETVKAGGNMMMPGTVIVTLRTRLSGTVNIYHFDEQDDRYTRLATTAVQDGKVTFSTRQMGNMVITTGTI